MKNKRLQNKGITLIALVITVIILLILAGVAIATLTGPNGIITNAQEAKTKTEEANKKEQEKLEQMEEYILQYVDPWNGEIANSFAGGDGSQTNPYQITNAEELAYFAKTVNEGTTYEGQFVEIKESINLGNQKFTPIGLGPILDGQSNWTESKQVNAFAGTLDGKNNVIANLHIDEQENFGVGLIGSLESTGIIKNLTISNGQITGGDGTGGIVGMSKGTVENCINKATIISQDKQSRYETGERAGGIVGYALKGEIKNCLNTGNVTAKDTTSQTSRGKYAGGIVGLVKSLSEEDIVTVDNCINEGEITCEYMQVGGIVGSHETGCIIQNCENRGKIVAKYNEILAESGRITGSYAGGILSWIMTDNVTISNCTNSGEVIAEDNYAGGIVGSQGGGTINNCSNSGKITVEDTSSGGIVGRQGVGTVSNCTNSGEVISKNTRAGGISGYQSSGTIENCNNSGKVTAEYLQSGGIAGYQATGTINNCTNSGEIIANSQQSGGIVGNQGYGTISNCSNSGTITSKAMEGRGISGGIIGWQDYGEATNVYNTGEIITENNTSGIDTIGGIIGGQNRGTLTNAYNKGTLAGGEAKGGIIGQKKLAGTVQKTYYYTDEEIQGIGSESDDTTAITPAEDQPGKVEKTTENIDTFEKFIEWIATQ